MNDEIKLKLRGLYFTWDDKKAKINERKHKITFPNAAEVFFDKFFVEEPDYTTDEERYRIIGKGFSHDSPILFVVFTERIFIGEEGRQIFRIISARIADRKDIDKYYDYRGIH